jgi:hypothetical protein
METGGETISILLDYLQRSFSAFRHGLSSITSQQCSGSSLAELQAALKGDPTMDDNTRKENEASMTPEPVQPAIDGSRGLETRACLITSSHPCILYDERQGGRGRFMSSRQRDRMPTL